MQRDALYCSIEAQTHGAEPLYGTAIRADRCVFISWPRAWWGQTLLDTRFFPTTLLEKMRGVTRIRNTRFYFFQSRPIAHRDDPLTWICMPCGKLHSIPLDSFEAAIEAHISGACVCPSREADAVLPNSAFICTHGVRDKCCAKFGFTFAQQLRDLATAANFNLSVFETSHLGGDRFAGTGMFFPSGEMHGWLRPELAPNILASLQARDIHKSTYRGSIFLDRPEQVAEAFLVSRGITGAGNNSTATFSVQEPTDFSTRVVVQTADLRVFDCELKRDAFDVVTSCSELAEQSKRSIRRWVVDAWSER